jgi:hypothetical protein
MFASSVLLCVLLTAPAPETLSIDLGSTNQEHGLSVPTGGDGTNQPATVAGSACRRITGDKSLYLYVCADDARVPAGRYDAYLTVDYFDENLGTMQVQYDKVPDGHTSNSRYATAEDTILMVGTGQWQRAVLRLPDARFGNGQNFNADLRLHGAEVAVRRLELSFTPPKGYIPGGVDPSLLDKIRASRRPAMELTFGCDGGPAQALLFRSLGVTSVESYVTWQTVEDAAQDQWDWSRWDRQVDILQQADLKWVPFLVLGPGYATPKWYRESQRSAPYVCLEHGTPSKIQSLWNPDLRPWVDRFIKTFADRYRDRGVIESVLLGVTGTYGETLYPSGPEKGWTYEIPGMFHNHRGWWAGDRFAVADFRKYLQKRYGTIGALNQAWNLKHASFDTPLSFDDLTTFQPSKAPSHRAAADMADWYVQSMTEWSVFWVATTRKYLPKTEIYLCVGGAGEPDLGADFSALAKAIRPFDAGIRITNEASNYAHNFTLTREVATACRAVGTFFGTEPAGTVTAVGNSARIYNATASGALQLFCYRDNVLQTPEAMAVFRQYAPTLDKRQPRVPAGIYLPKTSWALDEGCLRRVFDAAAKLRDRTDLEFVDRTTLGSPALREMRVLALPDAPYVEPAELAALENWVKAGGILVARVAPNRPLLETPEGNTTARDALLVAPPAGLQLARMQLDGRPPRRFRVEVGQGSDMDYLFGQWHGPESGGEFKRPGATKRWSGARAGLYLPCDPTVDATLLLTGSLTGHSLPGPNRVLVNGQPVGTLAKAGTQTSRFAVPHSLLAGRPVAEVTLEIRTFKPSEHGASDTRELGLALSAAELVAKGAENEPLQAGRLQMEIDWAAAARCVRRLGRGATVAVPSQNGLELAEVVVQALQHPERLVPAATGITLPSPASDGIFATQLSDGILYYNSTTDSQNVNGVEVPGHGIAFQKAK